MPRQFSFLCVFVPMLPKTRHSLSFSSLLWGDYGSTAGSLAQAFLSWIIAVPFPFERHGSVSVSLFPLPQAASCIALPFRSSFFFPLVFREAGPLLSHLSILLRGIRARRRPTLPCCFRHELTLLLWNLLTFIVRWSLTAQGFCPLRAQLRRMHLANGTLVPSIFASCYSRPNFTPRMRQILTLETFFFSGSRQVLIASLATLPPP